MLIYCDSVILIYFLDHVGGLNVRAATRLAALSAAGDQIGVSDLVCLECRVKPLRMNDTARLAIFDAFFARPDVRVVPITTAVFDRATRIRAAHSFKPADSLHLAAAIEGRCDRFLTNDLRLSAFTDQPFPSALSQPTGSPKSQRAWAAGSNRA
jgi:predicted nucleic acid-binding protein